MRTMARIGLLVCTAVLFGRADAFAGNEALLNGRYSFVAQGTEGDGQSQHVTRVGTLVFDGNGNVTACRIREVIDGQPGGAYGDQGLLPFTQGTYTVGSNNLGRITIEFTSVFPPNAVTTEVWDIAVTNGGKSVDLMVHSSTSAIATITLSNQLTVSGEATAN